MIAEAKITKEMINDLRAKEDDAHRKYREACKAIEDAEKLYRQQESGLEKGDLVSVTLRGKKGFYFFDHFDAHGWAYGYARRINGEPSKAVTCLYTNAMVKPKL